VIDANPFDESPLGDPPAGWSDGAGPRPRIGGHTDLRLAPDGIAENPVHGPKGQARSGPGEGTDGQDVATAAHGVGSRTALRGLRILIVDDCTLHRENLAAAFRASGAADVGVAWDLPSLVFALGATRPNALLLNIASHDSALLLRAATDIDPDARVIVLGVSADDEARIVACAEAGVAGYHMRTETLADLLILIRRVAAGETSFSTGLASMLLRRLASVASQRQPETRELVLTGREAQILQMLELGLSNHDIATRLSIAVHTVKNHVHSLLKKLGVSTRAEAAALSRIIGLHHQ
jgi:DNA-binding NarL/FixJ family response regulator